MISNNVFYKYSRLHILGSCYIGIPGSLNHGYCRAFSIKLTTSRSREFSIQAAPPEWCPEKKLVSFLIMMGITTLPVSTQCKDP